MMTLQGMDHTTQISDCRFMAKKESKGEDPLADLGCFCLINATNQILLHLIISEVFIPFLFPFNFYRRNLLLCFGDLLEETTAYSFTK